MRPFSASSMVATLDTESVQNGEMSFVGRKTNGLYRTLTLTPLNPQCQVFSTNLTDLTNSVLTEPLTYQKYIVNSSNYTKMEPKYLGYECSYPAQVKSFGGRVCAVASGQLSCSLESPLIHLPDRSRTELSCQWWHFTPFQIINSNKLIRKMKTWI